MTPNTTALQVTPIVILGQVLAFSITLALAGLLRPEEFAAYVTAATLFSLLAALAPLGTEKLALRVLPQAFDTADHAQVRAYLHFALRRSTVGCVAAILCALIWSLAQADLSAATRRAVLASCAALPFGVATHLAQEILTAARQARFAMLAARMLVPAITLALLLLMRADDVAGALAIGCWALGWLIAAALMWARIPGLPFGAAPVRLPQRARNSWAAAARPLWLYRLAVGLRAQIGLLALVWWGAPTDAVGAYATAQAIVGLLVVPVVATNRVFAREISRHLGRGDEPALSHLRHQRLWLLMPVVCGFVAITWIWALPILQFVRPEFAAIGAAPLRILSLASALTLLLSLAPTQLKFRDRNRQVFAILTAAVAVQTALLIVLVPPFAATGAAWAYALPTTVSYAVFAVMSRRSGRNPTPI